MSAATTHPAPACAAAAHTIRADLLAFVATSCAQAARRRGGCYGQMAVTTPAPVLHVGCEHGAPADWMHQACKHRPVCLPQVGAMQRGQMHALVARTLITQGAHAVQRTWGAPAEMLLAESRLLQQASAAH